MPLQKQSWIADITRGDERLQAMGFHPVDNVTPHAANAFIRSQGPYALPVDIQRSYVQELPSGEVNSASIIRQDGRQSVVSLPLNGLQLRDAHPDYPKPSKVDYAEFVNGAPLTTEASAQHEVSAPVMRVGTFPSISKVIGASLG